jgi:hypothetical protein
MKPRQVGIPFGAAVLAAPLVGLLSAPAAGSGSAGAAPAKAPAYYQYPGTKMMADRLETMIQQADAMSNTFLNDRRAEIFRKAMQDAQSPKAHVDMQANLAQELLSSGQTDTAIKEIVSLMTFVSQNFKAFSPKQRTFLLNLLAVCRLRQGEEQNCLYNHNTDSCRVPIRGAGVHTVQDGSRRAIKVLAQQLGEFPDDLEARWLLNLGYMTIGEYPDNVPPRWLVPPKAFESDYDIKRFPDRAGDLGLDVDDLAGGSITEDFDGDGDLDIMASTMALRGQLRYFRNNSDGTFTERTKEAGLLGEVGGLNITHSDYDNDGDPDVLVLRGGWMVEDGRYPNSLLRNNGDGTFADVTEEAGVLSFHPTQTAAWLDFDNDGFIDFYIGNESSPGHDHPCELYRNNGNGTFTECAAAAGVANVAYVKAVGSGDFNNDGRPDIYLSRRGDDNVLYRNDGPKPGGKSKCDWAFTDVARAAGVTEPKFSFPTWFFDYDNDGWLDILVTGYSIRNVGDVAADYLGLSGEGEKARLYHNNRDGTFRDVSVDAHLFKVLHAMGSNFGDLDNDGWLDFYLGTGDPKLGTLIPNRMFRNAEGKYFQDVTSSGGFGHLQKGHGVSFADLDNDGDQDIYEIMGGAYTGDRYRNALYENPGHGNHWITLKLEGVKTNRAAIGARIKVTVETPAGERTIHRTVTTGGSFGDSPLRQQIGLGQARAIRSIEIFWPTTGATQRLAPPAMDAVYRVREGDPTPVPIRLKPFKFATRPRPVHDHAAHTAGR